MSDKPKRRWLPRYSLGTAFAAFTVVAVVVGYYANWIRQRQEAQVWIESHEPIQKQLVHILPPIEPGPRLPWILTVLGEEPNRYVIQIEKQDGETMDAYVRGCAMVRRVFPESSVFDLSNWQDAEQ